MLVSYTNLKSLPVFTKSGTYLGKVHDLIIDAGSHSVRQYEVRGGRIRGKTYLIAANAVLEISQDKMVVADAILTELAQKEESRHFTKNISPALTSSYKI